MEQRKSPRRRRAWALGVLLILLIVAVVGWRLTDESNGEVFDPHKTDWKNIAVPAAVCGGGGEVRLRNGVALVSSSRWPDAWAGTTPSTIPNQVEVTFYGPVKYGDLGNDGIPEAVVPIWCDNGGGTADGQLGQALVVFTGRAGQPSVMATITTSQPGTYHAPYFDNERTRIAPGQVTVEELWYSTEDSTCCPSGRAETVWTYTGATLLAGTPRITTRPTPPSAAPTIVEPFSALPCNPKASATASVVGCLQERVVGVDGKIDATAAEIFRVLSIDARRRFTEGEDAWWSYRDAACRSRADEFEGGSAAEIATAACLLARSDDHLVELTVFRTSLTKGH